ncbi:penicillin-binding protein 1A [Kiloniella laminariae]|uniref:Penicillin-binding protein 1A n=1 Tax=Kiloniella laminariae TaxID=454162 RepID=A0ABT4LET8_9PROT|nr:penicillin-binding protein 1A [Kiloniella laminariae]MCZ4279435.1 penicillin-binding protein 1A [Kiloniella laminariae]
MKFLKIIGYLFAIGIVLAIAGAGGAIYVFYEYGRGLPDHNELVDYDPPTVTRVHAGDGRLLEEYAREKRIYVPIEAIPERVKDAFLSAEDKDFYSHPGINFFSLARAMVTNIKNVGSGKRLIGASTITQQVAKNFLLTNEVSYERKIKEAILTFRIEQSFGKERILDLYLNEIFLGYRSYGVAVAALNYFNKSLDELTVAEAAYLAALPKAPSNYHPVRRHEAALERRNWVIDRMLENNKITAEEAEIAWQSPLQIIRRDDTEVVNAPYFAEEVRRELLDLYGEEKLYEDGFSVRTTLQPKFQDIAQRSLKAGLIEYDRRHGWRGPLTRYDPESPDGWKVQLEAMEVPRGVEPWVQAAVLEVGDNAVTIGFVDGTRGTIPMTELKWARKWIEDQRYGEAPRSPGDVLTVGDVVLVEAVLKDAKDQDYPADTFALRQIPDVNGGIVAMDPHTGRVLAMSGGFSFGLSVFNRATQAVRQPGSAIKPFIYLAGLDHGYTPATLIQDAPFSLDQGAGLGKWKPSNYTNKFYGPTRMRVGLEDSKNLMTVRLAQNVGMETIVEYVKRFGIDNNMEPVLSMSLGAGETSLLQMTTAYAMLVNGGKKIIPSLIDRIQDRRGQTVFKHDQRNCLPCVANDGWHQQAVPELPDTREQIVDPASAYQVVSMLEGAVLRGTGRRISSIGKPLAGKTGTTNDSQDAWFLGFSPDLAVGVYVGFDNPKTLGRKEQGASVAAPIFKSFMEEALEDAPATPFRVPSGIRLVRINAETGRLASPNDSNVIVEAFKPDTVPSADYTGSGEENDNPLLSGNDLLTTDGLY